MFANANFNVHLILLACSRWWASNLPGKEIKNRFRMRMSPGTTSGWRSGRSYRGKPEAPPGGSRAASPSVDTKFQLPLESPGEGFQVMIRVL